MPALQLVWGDAYRRSGARSAKDQRPKGGNREAGSIYASVARSLSEGRRPNS